MLVLWSSLAPAAGPASAAFRSQIDAGPLRLESPPELRGTLEDLAARAETILPQLERSLGVRPSGPIAVFLIPAGPIADPELARLDRAAPPWAAGFALTDRRVIAIRLGRADRYPFGDASGVLAHEITHVLLHDAAGTDVPRWFSEGVSTREQRRWSVRDAVVYSSSLVIGRLPSLAQMDRAFVQSEASARIAYAASFDFVNWSAREYGDGVVRRVLEAARSRPFPEAWQAATGVALPVSESGWRGTALTWYRWIPVLTGAGTLWLAITLLFLLAAWRRRRKTQTILAQMEVEDTLLRSPGPRRPTRRSDRDEEGNWVN